jgi:hypothetical protein
MLKRISFLIGLAALATGPALADVIDVIVDGSVSGSGSVSVACGITTPGCEPIGDGRYRLTSSYTFAGSNTELGPFDDSGSATSPIFPASVGGYADQDTTATSDTLNIELMGGHFASTSPTYTASESDTVSVSFDLTERSLIELSGGAYAFPSEPSDVGELLDSNGNEILVLPNSPSSVFADLGPGLYRLDASASGGGQGGLVSFVDDTDFDLNLDATFSPIAVPEPRWVLFAAFLAIMIGGYAVSWLRRVVM